MIVDTFDLLRKCVLAVELWNEMHPNTKIWDNPGQQLKSFALANGLPYELALRPELVESHAEVLRFNDGLTAVSQFISYKIFYSLEKVPEMNPAHAELKALVARKAATDLVMDHQDRRKAYISLNQEINNLLKKLDAF